MVLKYKTKFLLFSQILYLLLYSHTKFRILNSSNQVIYRSHIIYLFRYRLKVL